MLFHLVVAGYKMADHNEDTEEQGMAYNMEIVKKSIKWEVRLERMSENRITKLVYR